ALQRHEAGQRHQHGQAHILRRRRHRDERGERRYCAAPPAQGDITSFMPVSSPLAGSRTMQDGLAKPRGETWLPTSTIGSRPAIAFFTASGRSRLTRMGPTPDTSMRGGWEAVAK